MKILIIDDELRMSQILKEQLIRRKFTVKCVNNYDQAVDIVLSEVFDLIICDYVLSPIKKSPHWIDFVKEMRIRWNKIPIIILTWKWQNCITPWDCLNAGADDFLQKPYAINELIARIFAIIRRSYLTVDSSTNIITDWNLKLNLSNRSLYINNIEIALSNIPFLILSKLIQNKWKIMSQKDLIEYIWWDDDLFNSQSTATLRVHITYLKKINPIISKSISTIHWIWYIWNDN